MTAPNWDEFHHILHVCNVEPKDDALAAYIRARVQAERAACEAASEAYAVAVIAAAREYEEARDARNTTQPR
jgi:hypothetical protein